MKLTKRQRLKIDFVDFVFNNFINFNNQINNFNMIFIIMKINYNKYYFNRNNEIN